MKKILAALAAVAAIIISQVGGKDPKPPKDPGPTPTPIPSPTPPPEPIPSQAISGRAVIEFKGLEKIPLAKTLDNIIIGNLTWEMSGKDRSLPILELAVRGTKNEPCLKTPCGDKMGLIVRWSANLKWDSTLDWSDAHDEESAEKSCGEGINYHQRMALGPITPSLLVEVIWSSEGLTVKTPASTATWNLNHPVRSEGVLGFGRFVPGCPWKRGERGWLWDTFSSDRFGVTSKVITWESLKTGVPLNPCPKQ